MVARSRPEPGAAGAFRARRGRRSPGTRTCRSTTTRCAARPALAHPGAGGARRRGRDHHAAVLVGVHGSGTLPSHAAGPADRSARARDPIARQRLQHEVHEQLLLAAQQLFGEAPALQAVRVAALDVLRAIRPRPGSARSPRRRPSRSRTPRPSLSGGPRSGSAMQSRSSGAFFSANARSACVRAPSSSGDRSGSGDSAAGAGLLRLTAGAARACAVPLPLARRRGRRRPADRPAAEAAGARDRLRPGARTGTPRPRRRANTSSAKAAVAGRAPLARARRGAARGAAREADRMMGASVLRSERSVSADDARDAVAQLLDRQLGVLADELAEVAAAAGAAIGGVERVMSGLK